DRSQAEGCGSLAGAQSGAGPALVYLTEASRQTLRFGPAPVIERIVTPECRRAQRAGRRVTNQGDARQHVRIPSRCGNQSQRNRRRRIRPSLRTLRPPSRKKGSTFWAPFSAFFAA